MSVFHEVLLHMTLHIKVWFSSPVRERDCCAQLLSVRLASTTANAVTSQNKHGVDKVKIAKIQEVMDQSQQINLDDLRVEGCMVWAKVRGFSYWPGIVTVDPMDGLTVKMAETSGSKRGRARSRVHVHFLGYDNMRAWVLDSDVILYQGTFFI